MTKFQKIWTVVLRLALGGLFLYAGISKATDPTWSAVGYLQSAKTFAWFYHALATPSILPVIDFLNTWGQILIGSALILGVGVRLASIFGSLMMLLYYFPVLQFPYIAPHYFLIDDHIIYLAALMLVGNLNAGSVFGLGNWVANWPMCQTNHRLKKWLT